MKPDEIRKRFEQQWSSRSIVKDRWDQVARSMDHARGMFFKTEVQESSIEWGRRWMYDGTATHSYKKLSSHLHASLTSPAIQWFDMRYRDPALNESVDAKAWLEKAASTTYDALQDSNFSLQAAEVYKDLVLFGTAAIVHEEAPSTDGWGGFTFSAIPMKEVYFEPDQYGQCYVFYRLLSWKPSQLISKFKDVPERVLKAYEQNNDQKIDVIFCIYRRPGVTASSPRMAPKARPYGYRYVMRESGDELGEEGGYYEMPAYIPRYETMSESQWGNSPGMDALADCYTLNQLIELTLDNVDKALDPPLMHNEGAVIGEIDQTARGVTQMRDINEIAPLPLGINYQAGEMKIEDLRQNIRNHFHISDLQLKESPAMTATEVRVRYEEMQKFLAPTLGNIEEYFLSPLVARAFNILLRAGEFDEIPEIVANDQRGFDVEYLGQLAQSQKADKATNIQQWIGFLAQLAEVIPDIMDTVDSDAVARELADITGVPAKVLQSKGKVKEARERRQQQQEQLAAAEQAQMDGQAAEATGKATQAIRGV